MRGCTGVRDSLAKTRKEEAWDGDQGKEEHPPCPDLDGPLEAQDILMPCSGLDGPLGAQDILMHALSLLGALHF